MIIDWKATEYLLAQLFNKISPIPRLMGTAGTYELNLAVSDTRLSQFVQNGKCDFKRLGGAGKVVKKDNNLLFTLGQFFKGGEPKGEATAELICAGVISGLSLPTIS